jgi:Txe/YoeB family toxin of toxin-antitoxin system
MHKLLYSPLAKKDSKKLAKSYLRVKCQELLDVIARDPYAAQPSYEKLSGDYYGCLSRRINIQHRLVYEVDEGQKIIKVHRMWSRYE